LRFSGYSALAVLNRPRSLSSSVTRTLSVPKSTPATIATLVLPGYQKIAIQVSKRFIIHSQPKATGPFRQ
jgi:hypothetical protein